MSGRELAHLIGGFILGVIAAIVFALMTSPAAAQDAVSGSISGSALNSNIQAGAGAVNSNYFAAPKALRNTEVATTAQVTAPGFSSGHPCGYAPLSVGAGIVGYGLSAGGQQIDDACLLAQMGYTQEAMMMIAARSAVGCEALRTTGKIAASSDCSGRDGFRKDRGTTTVATKSPVARPDLVFTKCELDANGAVRLGVKRGADKALAISQCKATLGVR
jgi:hypothetical protein